MDKRNVANKASLVEPIIRHRVQDSLFYKQYLHLTNEQSILPVVAEHVQFVAGTDSSSRPSPFLCCLVRMLEIEPPIEIVRIYLDQNGYQEFKYLTALTLLYCRMVMGAADFYVLHDEYIKDYRKLRFKGKNPTVTDEIPVHYKIKHMDEWVDELATEERVVDIKIPYMGLRLVYIERGLVGEREYGAETSDDSEGEESEEYQSDSD
ncbi:PRP38-domain-containing protein [Metschnikowia bicuspidata var. bicuspidata NRRL YB-4993]|uniref:Pre-mRNA-splicing factor 38 n=1 Tax=Metschnikowia bicuspidata var. bicuspidata NRRL YB-4993 TaxID=869754 RepID=A0A1A0HH64_9ASCO|nr:PRP38-domain-containing protein [Metschnikowia bicuspidata var. bicuspidata NRRL YB-4993]OBA23341.1 PRP38-domain-containing protein [Metschnikowia bicuspidata var. bicuspidata NRRL YB-4993]